MEIPDTLAMWDRQYSPGVDWAGGYRWGHVDEGLYVFSALNQSWEWALPGSQRSWHVDRVGDGVVRVGWHGVRLVVPGGNALTVLTPTSRPLYRLHVGAPDGDGCRWVNLVLGGRPRRFHVDLGTPQVLEAPGDAGRVARLAARFGHRPVWHPTQGLVALDQRHHRTMVMTTAGAAVCRLPDGSVPLAWLPNDRSLLVADSDATADSPTAHLARWHMPDAVE